MYLLVGEVLLILMDITLKTIFKYNGYALSTHIRTSPMDPTQPCFAFCGGHSFWLFWYHTSC